MTAVPGNAPSNPRHRLFRAFVLVVVILVIWVPGFVALAMLLTGNAG